jgi:hypothetical protein
MALPDKIETFQNLPVLKAYLCRGGKFVVTEFCPFCSGCHVHIKPFLTYSLCYARCRERGLEIKASDGQILNNDDGYYVKFTKV